MNLKNWLTLTLRTTDFNLVARQPDLLQKLRDLTLSQWSGLNHEMDRMLLTIEERPVNCKIILAQRFTKLIGWALLSKEASDFPFVNSDDGYSPDSGWLFQVFIDYPYRKQGIATEIFRVAKGLVNDEVLCVCPHDGKSVNFYTKLSESTPVKYL